MINPYVFPIKGDISRADVVVLYEEAISRRGTIFEFGVGASTIILASSGNRVIAFEDDQEWLERVRKNVSLYANKMNQELFVNFKDINYDNPVHSMLAANIKKEKPFLFLVDGKSSYRVHVLDCAILNAEIGDVILIHDTRSAGHQKTVTDALRKYYNKIDSCYFNHRMSNLTKIVVKEQRDYVNWNIEEKDNVRMSWDKDDTGL